MAKTGLLICWLLLVPAISKAGISWDNEILWLLASSNASSSSHFVQWKNTLENANDCVFAGSNIRTRISSNDKELYSLLLAAKLANKKVSFFYNTTTALDIVPGHTSGCEIRSAWIRD